MSSIEQEKSTEEMHHESVDESENEETTDAVNAIVNSHVLFDVPKTPIKKALNAKAQFII